MCEMKKIIQVYLALFLMTIMAGCATYRVRNPDCRSVPHAYPAVEVDCREWIWEMGILGNVCDAKLGWLTRIAVVICSMVDLPISVVTDTLCLPWDLYHASKF